MPQLRRRHAPASNVMVPPRLTRREPTLAPALSTPLDARDGTPLCDLPNSYTFGSLRRSTYIARRVLASAQST
ncbi:hypothetical protein BN2476_830094 [Paraburkholderia piptadeniae]|uniref:Uncharacterized protein n=1 Tax=Paraburkholderia piptadeniae TaxID=1701573 RepID=A0A1N7ST10_9BURK|nr:hypothetical protein BN2476_830094 [Paraburkholderia piptadeniae]